MPVSKNKRKKKKSPRSGKNRTPIDQHEHSGKTLHAPFSKLGNKMVFSSWTDERLPEMIWAAIIRVINGQDFALSEFRRILTFIGKHDSCEAYSDITLSGISKLDDDLRSDLIEFITQNELTAAALSTLLLFDRLPARESWKKYLNKYSPSVDLLMKAVGINLPHQSQEATDCRWFRLMAQVVTGKFQIPQEMAHNLFGYPNEGDQRSVRPMIRASEIGFSPVEEKDVSWAEAFWEDGWHNTPCLALREKTENQDTDTFTEIDPDKINFIIGELEAHWENTHETTAIDAKHDAVFGLSFYVLRVLEEITLISKGILGRLGLRTILESYISLHYLLSKDEPELWKKWRKYGAGQAKLNALRFDFDMNPPKHINVATMDEIAGEDLWEEFLSIELGSWSGLDLRKISIKSGLKEIYDQHYSWTSGYVHGSWGPVRESCYDTCGNPLHRLHRYPARNRLSDTTQDAAELVDAVLSDLDQAYPGFSHRLLS